MAGRDQPGVVRERGYAKGRAKRRQILDQAMALFGEVGYRAASLREIAARCGISHPGLLHHFPTKQALLLAVLQYRDEVDAELVAGRVGVDALRGLLDLVRRNTGRRAIVELFTVLSGEATAADHPAHGFFVRRYQKTLINAESAYTQADEAGELRPGVDPGTAARQLVALMDGLQIQWLLDDGRTDMVEVLRTHLGGQLAVRV